MRFRTLTLAALLSAGFAPQKGLDKPTVANGRAPRLHRDVVFKRDALPGLPGWQVQWDRDTNVPLRAWGPSISAPNTTRKMPNHGSRLRSLGPPASFHSQV